MRGQFARIRSWHVIATPTRLINGYALLCGRRVVTTDVRAELPAERSCESCLRILARGLE